MQYDSLYLLIKPASGRCNLRCGYCFYASLSEAGAPAGQIMKRETAEKIIDRALETDAKRITFSFQGGEPTLAGIEFFRTFCDCAETKNINHAEISYSIQTNGMCVDEAFTALFSKRRFLVGISLDGTKNIHDTLRKDPEGKGSYTRVQKAIGLLTRANVDYNLLCVVSSLVARHGAAVYEGMKKTGCRNLQFIPCIPPFEGQGEKGAWFLSPEDYLAFLRTAFSRYVQDIKKGDYVSVRYFDNLIRLAGGKPPEMCGLFGACPGQMIAEADGSVYPCDFYVLPERCMGNLCRQSIDEIMQSPERRRFIEQSYAVAEKCRACPVVGLCRGGCRRDRQSVPDAPVGENRFCETYRTFLTESYPTLVSLARMLL